MLVCCCLWLNVGVETGSNVGWLSCLICDSGLYWLRKALSLCIGDGCNGFGGESFDAALEGDEDFDDKALILE